MKGIMPFFLLVMSLFLIIPLASWADLITVTAKDPFNEVVFDFKDEYGVEYEVCEIEIVKKMRNGLVDVTIAFESWDHYLDLLGDAGEFTVDLEKLEGSYLGAGGKRVLVKEPILDAMNKAAGTNCGFMVIKGRAPTNRFDSEGQEMVMVGLSFADPDRLRDVISSNAATFENTDYEDVQYLRNTVNRDVVIETGVESKSVTHPEYDKADDCHWYWCVRGRSCVNWDYKNGRWWFYGGKCTAGWFFACDCVTNRSVSVSYR